MRLPLAAAVALAVLAPRAARGAPLVALRLGVAPAIGSVVDDVPTSDGVRLQIPVQLDAGWTFGPLAIGAYGSWGWAQVGSCNGSCSGSVVRAGVQATFTLPPFGEADPWLGVGAGYEWATERRERAGHEVTTRWRGFELPSVQGGLEWRVARAVALGPYLLVGFGRYSDTTLDTGIESASAEIPEKALHVWIHAGVRARLAFEGVR